MQLGAYFPTAEVGVDLATTRAWAQAVQELGYDFAASNDHVVGAEPEAYPEDAQRYSIDNSFREPLTLFASLAGVAPGLGFLSYVVFLPQRQAVLVAKQAAEIDRLCNGRLRLGVGIGWNKIEFDALGMSFANRGRRFEEQIDVMRRLWTERVVTFDGRHHQFRATGINPMPVQQPIPIWIGASVEAALKRACVIGDGYLPFIPLEGGWHATMDKVHGWLREAGRDPTRFGIGAYLQAGTGTPDEWLKTIEMWRGFGASLLIVDTEGLGGVDAHVRRLREVKDVVGS
jgi:probable F420-dependent oxidoreductase